MQVGVEKERVERSASRERSARRERERVEKERVEMSAIREGVRVEKECE